MASEFGRVEAVLSGLPYHLNVDVAKSAHGAGIHYFDLTEDVPTTRAIFEMSATSKGLMAPQCGLAPGFVGIVGAWPSGASPKAPWCSTTSAPLIPRSADNDP